LTNRIDVLALWSKSTSIQKRYIPLHADTAIWRFNELMYLSYPPGDVLRFLNNAWAKRGEIGDKSFDEEVIEYERYRWAVMEWCLKNWARIVADSAETYFIQSAISEVENNTNLVERLIEACSIHYRDNYINKFIKYCIETLARMELQRQSPGKADDTDRISRILKLDIGLTMFFMGNPKNDYDLGASNNSLDILMDSMIELSYHLNQYGHSLINNILLRITRPQRIANPIWALNVVAESLLRGRDFRNAPTGGHHLLPKLINNLLTKAGNIEDRRLLEGSLGVFLAALDDILPYALLGNISPYAEEVKYLCMEILEWLKYPPEAKEFSKKPPALRRLNRLLILEGGFIKSFNRIFNENIYEIKSDLDCKYEEIINQNYSLEYDFNIDGNSHDCSILTLVHMFTICLSNLTIDPIKKLTKDTKCRSRILVTSQKDHTGSEKVIFRCLTNFASLDETNNLTSKGRSISSDQSNLAAFGVEFDPKWSVPNPLEAADGFTAAFQIYVPRGFTLIKRGD